MKIATFISWKNLEEEKHTNTHRKTVLVSVGFIVFRNESKTNKKKKY